MKKSNLVKHAERELKLAGMFDKDADYNGTLAPQIIKLVEEFSKQEHSGMSAEITIQLLVKLLKFKTITPITNHSDEWMKVDKKMWQNTRDGSYFSKDGGKTYYNINK